MFYGRGAGEMPTASAVVGDVFDIVRNLVHGTCGRIGCTCYRNLPVIAMDETANRYFIRMQVENTCGVLAAVAKVLGDNCVSVAQMIQKNVCGEHAEIVLITDRVRMPFQGFPADIHGNGGYPGNILCDPGSVIKDTKFHLFFKKILV